MTDLRENGLKWLPEQDAVFGRILARRVARGRVGLAERMTSWPRSRADQTDATNLRATRGRIRPTGAGNRPQDGTDFLREPWQADLVLDMVHWSGGVTAFETFWGDVPILTVSGQFMRGRHTAGMLNEMALPEAIAADVEVFVAKAMALGRDPEALSRLRAQIAERKHRLYRDSRVIDALADRIETNVQRLSA